MFLGLDIPPVSHLVNWPDVAFKGQWYALNKIGILSLASMAITLLLFFIAGSKKKLVPTGIQNLIEIAIEFVRDGIVMQTMGNDGLVWWPFLTAIFFFILIANLFGLLPFVQMPATARMAIPAFIAILVWFCFNVVGVVKQGPGKYLKGALFPPGVPVAFYILITPIEFVSTFLVRPISLAVRVFANVLAGHILLVTIVAFCTLMFNSGTAALKPVSLIPWILLVLLSGFELLVAVLQAYIFTILAAVYIGGAIHPDH